MIGIYSYCKFKIIWHENCKNTLVDFKYALTQKKADIKTDSEIILQFNCKKEDTSKNQFTVSVTWNCTVTVITCNYLNRFEKNLLDNSILKFSQVQFWYELWSRQFGIMKIFEILTWNMGRTFVSDLRRYDIMKAHPWKMKYRTGITQLI